MRRRPGAARNEVECDIDDPPTPRGLLECQLERRRVISRLNPKAATMTAATIIVRIAPGPSPDAGIGSSVDVGGTVGSGSGVVGVPAKS